MDAVRFAVGNGQGEAATQPAHDPSRLGLMLLLYFYFTSDFRDETPGAVSGSAASGAAKMAASRGNGGPTRAQSRFGGGPLAFQGRPKEARRQQRLVAQSLAPFVLRPHCQQQTACGWR
jgi:hypothetical protein